MASVSPGADSRLDPRWQDAPTMSTAEPTSAGTAAHATLLEAAHELEQATLARPQDAPRLAAALERAVDACRRWPQAASGVLYLPELLGELSEAYEQLGRTERRDRARPATGQRAGQRVRAQLRHADPQPVLQFGVGPTQQRL